MPANPDRENFTCSAGSARRRVEAYPRTFRANFYPEKQSYRFVFSGFKAGDQEGREVSQVSKVSEYIETSETS